MNGYPAIECEEVLRHLFAYIDGELESEAQQQLEQHLHKCRSCFSRWEFERRLKAHLLELGNASVPLGFEERVRALVTQLPE